MLQEQLAQQDLQIPLELQVQPALLEQPVLQVPLVRLVAGAADAAGVTGTVGNWSGRCSGYRRTWNDWLNSCAILVVAMS